MVGLEKIEIRLCFIPVISSPPTALWLVGGDKTVRLYQPSVPVIHFLLLSLFLLPALSLSSLTHTGHAGPVNIRLVNKSSRFLLFFLLRTIVETCELARE